MWCTVRWCIAGWSLDSSASTSTLTPSLTAHCSVNIPRHFYIPQHSVYTSPMLSSLSMSLANCSLSVAVKGDTWARGQTKTSFFLYYKPSLTLLASSNADRSSSTLKLLINLAISTCFLYYNYYNTSRVIPLYIIIFITHFSFAAVSSPTSLHKKAE